jgi:hypothetical protein
MPLLDSSGNYVTQSFAGTPGFVPLAAVSAVQFGAVLNGIGAHGNHTMVVTSGAGASSGSVQLHGSPRRRLVVQHGSRCRHHHSLNNVRARAVSRNCTIFCGPI